MSKAHTERTEYVFKGCDFAYDEAQGSIEFLLWRRWGQPTDSEYP